MRVPALRACIGTREYYITTLTFQQVNDFVSKIDDQLYTSESLKDLLQRSITDNYISIKDYILNQPDIFFNALVLAVYDDYPDWREIEFKYEGEETYQMGLLEFPGNHKIFPVDGQHRVEGIKAALTANPELKNNKIAAIFVGHKNDSEGKEKTRRLFTTLNRYAKPVSLGDIIALDEDDTVAIVTRALLEEYDLFKEKRVIFTKQKAIPPANKDAITSIITLYQANVEIFKRFYEQNFNKKATPNLVNKYLKYRPSEEIIQGFNNFCIEYWNSFKNNLNFINHYVNTSINPAAEFRNNEIGGNILFRPIGFLPLVKSSLIIHQRRNIPFNEIFSRFNGINYNLDSIPWHFVAWNPIEQKMIMGSETVIQLLFTYLYDSTLLTPNELAKLKEGYAAKISYAGEINNVLDNIR